jgi:spoIIIJ-associated protein
VSDTDVTGSSDDVTGGPDTGTQATGAGTGVALDDPSVPAITDTDTDTDVDAEDEDVDAEDEDVDAEDEDDVAEDAGEDEGEEYPTADRRSRRGPSLKRLEEEGEVAADYLEELLDITDLDGDIDIDVENGRASVAIVAEGGADRQLRRLVGPRGEVLEALQELARLAVQAATGERSRLMLDVAGFRAARRRVLEDVAARACQEVQRGGQPVRLEPMSAFERKVVHDVVASAGLRSESEGEDPGRRVVVFPAKA